MKVIVDKEAKDILIRLCDIALRAGGLSHIESVARMIDAVEDSDADKVEPEAE